MPVPAPKTAEYLDACKLILGKFADGETLTPFESSSFSLLADSLKKSSPEESLQLKGMIALIQGDEDGFNKFFNSALLASSDQSIVRSNYALALATLGDYDSAGREIRILLQEPTAIFQDNAHSMCLKVCRMILDYDLADEILQLAKRFGIIDPSIAPEIWMHLATQLGEDDPLLFTMIDSDEISPRSEKTLQRLESLMAEVGVEHE